jgi:5'-3' exonuclease
MKYILVDTMNLFFRAKHSSHRASDTWTKLGFCLHIMFSAVNKVVNKLGADHVVFCLDGRSWRKDVYEPYKKNRKELRDKMSDKDREDDEVFFEIYEKFHKYLQEQSNCTVLKNDNAEADDLIARWIALHPTDEHIIVSSDSDFYQLLTNHVAQYNGISDQLITLDGFFDSKDMLVIDKKTKEPKLPPNPKWLLFEKCMRGDSSDNVFSAFPGVRTKSTKKRIGLIEAFDDMDNKGYAWNNLMLQHWTDHNDIEHRVMDDYKRNKQLIDLTQQPLSIKESIDITINTSITSSDVGNVGIRFLRFCGEYDLNSISRYPQQYAKWLNKTYKGVIND